MIGFIIGLVVGLVAGTFIMACCAASKDGDHMYDDWDYK